MLLRTRELNICRVPTRLHAYTPLLLIGTNSFSVCNFYPAYIVPCNTILNYSTPLTMVPAVTDNHNNIDVEALPMSSDQAVTPNANSQP